MSDLFLKIKMELFSGENIKKSSTTPTSFRVSEAVGEMIFFSVL